MNGPAPRPRALRLLPAVVRALLLAVGIAPFLPRAFPSASQPLQAWFAFQCSRAASRMLPIDVAVCARCLGIYVGFGLGALTLWPRLRPLPARLVIGVAALVMMLDVASEALGMRPPAPWFRLLTGLLLAYPAGATLVLELRAWAQKPITAPSDG